MPENSRLDLPPIPPIPPARRTVLRGVLAVGATGLAGAGLAGCGGGDDDDTAADAPGGSTADGPAGAGAAAAGTALGATSDVPVGGGTIFPDAQVVVTQPTAGTFKAFSSICTHEGCPVTKVADGAIECPCHGSKYSIEDGSVQRPPAPSPLPAVAISTTGGTITIA